jgi:NAD(P)-dependent dehydrogenase (short-subunit alcohol dehydrogenase family)
MKAIVITGSTRGIGYGLAQAFLARGCAVCISGRTQESVDAAVRQLSQEYPSEQISGQPCDVTQLDQVEALWAGAANHFGSVDIWINNAGIFQDYVKLWEVPDEQVHAVFDTNVIGTINGSRTAITHMLRQGYGAIYNMEGFGSAGRVRARMGIYASSKAAIRSFSKSLAVEAAESPVIIGTLSPGMVVTDLLLAPVKDNPADLAEVKKITNILGDRVETIAPWFADRILANDENGAAITWLTRRKIMWRFLSAPFHKRDLFAS